MDALALGYALGATTRARDFHPLETCAYSAHTEEPLGMTPRGSRPSSGGRDGGRLLDPAAEGVDVVPQECPVGAHDQHVDDVEADPDVAVGRVAREPGRCRDLKVAALDLAALESALAVLGCDKPSPEVRNCS